MFAKRVCKKYGLRLSCKFNSQSQARYYYTGKIQLSLFNENFYANFFHELAHHLDYIKSKKYFSRSYCSRFVKLLGNHNVGNYREGHQVRWYNNLLYCEARANRYALRLLKVTRLKGSGDDSWLRSCMTSYIRLVPLDYDALKQNKFIIADIDYKINKYLTY